MISTSRKLLAAAVVAIAAFSPFAFGDSLTLITRSSTPQAPDQNGVGGEFTALSVVGGTPHSFAPSSYNSGALYTFPAGSSLTGLTGFETFCVEYDTHFSPGPGTSYNYTIGSTIMPGAQPMAIGTAWLYSQFATGLLSGYNYTYDAPGTTPGGTSRYVDAGQLQNTIWWLQGQGGVSFNAGNPFMNLVVTQFGGAAAAKSAAVGNAYGVGVLNLTSLDSNGNVIYNQDQLIYGVPDGGFTLALFGAALLALFLVRKRSLIAA